MLDFLRSTARLYLNNEDRWVFVLGHDAWILQRICQEIQRHGDLNARFSNSPYPLPTAEKYFFSHYAQLIQYINQVPPRIGQWIVWFTHYEAHERRELTDILHALRRADKIACSSSSWERWIIEKGIEPAKVRCILPGAEPEMFGPRERTRRGVVGFVSRYYARKSPETIIGIIRAMPDLEFVILGPGWDVSPYSGVLSSLGNLRVVDVPYARYPEIYGEMDVFVTVSKVEGGPIPLVEAMMRNVVPVASRTGFAPDLITDGSNGFLCEVESDVQAIVALIRKALRLRGDVRESVEHLTWKNFAKKMLEFVEE